LAAANGGKSSTCRRLSMMELPALVIVSLRSSIVIVGGAYEYGSHDERDQLVR